MSNPFGSNSKMFVESIVYKPFAYEHAIVIDKEHEKMHWLEDEVPLGNDLALWNSRKLSENKKLFIIKILRMFTTQDVMVGSFYFDKLITVFKNNEIRNMLAGFAVREKTHQRSYSLLNETLGLPESDYASFLEYGEMKDKADFALEADNTTLEGLGLTLAKGVFNEGVSLFASFAMLLNFQRYGEMLGMAKIAEFSQKDENKHVEGVSWLFRVFCSEHPQVVTDEFKRKIYTIAREIVRLEDAFVDLVYGEHTIEGLTSNEVKEYIRYIADRRLNQLGLKENFKIDKNPLPWLDWLISGVQHTNFFESKSSDYAVAGLTGKWNYDDNKFVLYTKDDCPWCVKAKNLLSSKGLEFELIDLADFNKRQDFYNDKEFTDSERTMPKIYKNNKLIGGFTDLAVYLR